jgi:hypothetical protein
MLPPLGATCMLEVLRTPESMTLCAQAVAQDVNRLAMPGASLTLPRDLPANDEASRPCKRPPCS